MKYSTKKMWIKKIIFSYSVGQEVQEVKYYF